MIQKSIVLVCSIGLFLPACRSVLTTSQVIRGSGNVITQTREVSNFNQIVVSMGADLTLSQGNTESLEIQADDNLLPYIISEVLRGKLIIRARDNTTLSSARPIRLVVAFRDLAAIEVNGASNITADELDLNTLDISFNGAGSTRLSGTVDAQSIIIAGTATLHNYDLATQTIRLNIFGAGTAEVNAAESLDAIVAGTGYIFYTGDPQVTQTINGVGSVTRR